MADGFRGQVLGLDFSLSRHKVLGKRTLLGFVLILTLSSWPPAFNLRSVSASGVVYIRADGSVDPPTAPVSTINNVTYTLSGDIDHVVVERDNIVIDGANHTVFSTLTNYGILLNETSNVTVENMQVTAQLTQVQGVWLAIDGIRVNSCFNVSIIGNTFMDTVFALSVVASNETKVSDNNIFKSDFASSLFGVSLICEGITLIESSGSVISDNIITKVDYAVWIGYGSHGNNFYNNTVTQSKYGFGFSNLYSAWPSDTNNTDIADTSNTVDGKPVYYWVDKRDMKIPTDAGDVVLINCHNITVTNLNLTRNLDSILLVNTTDSSINQTTIVNGLKGVHMVNSRNITITGLELINAPIRLQGTMDSLITENFMSGSTNIELWQSSGNMIYHNEFDNYTLSVYLDGISSNKWDDGYPSGGNRWGHMLLSGGYANYQDMYWGMFQNRTGCDGIADTAYILDTNNIDHYPLASPYWYWKNPIIGDINRDAKVDMKDVNASVKSFGAIPTSPTWNPSADVNGPQYLHPDGKIDIRDVCLIARNVGKTAY